MRALSLPGGPGVRDDRGVAPGFEIPSDYDAMVSKLVVWGDTRESAVARLRRALAEYRVVGLLTTVPFFQWLVGQPAFLEGAFDTTFLDDVLARRDARQPFVPPDSGDERDAAIAVGLAEWLRARRADGGPDERERGVWRRTARLEGLR